MKPARVWMFLVMALVASGMAQTAKKYPAPDAYIDDYAHVLSEDGRARMETMCRGLHDRTRAQVFLVTVPSLGDDSIEQFSNDLFRQWKIGEKGTDRGLLVVFATGEHKHRIEVGYGFEGVLNDAKAGDIGRAITPALHERHYDEAGMEALMRLAAAVDPAGGTAPEGAAPASELSTPVDAAAAARSAANDDVGGIFAVLFLGGLVVAGGLYLLLRGRGRRSGPSEGGPGSPAYFGGDSSSESSDSGSFDSGSSSDGGFSGGDGGDSGGGGASGND